MPRAKLANYIIYIKPDCLPVHRPLFKSRVDGTAKMTCKGGRVCRATSEMHFRQLSPL